ncbi:EscU/YscU/HrcU family type III secretion system export apparatus switch protein [Vibrio metschnikovii]
MAESDGQERTEEATPRRLQQAKEKGQVARSKELASVSVLIIGFGSPNVVWRNVSQSLVYHDGTVFFSEL